MKELSVRLLVHDKYDFFRRLSSDAKYSRRKVFFVVPHGLEGQGGIQSQMRTLITSIEGVREPLVHRSIMGSSIITRSFWSIWGIVISLFRIPGCDVVHLNVAPHGSAYRKLVYGIISFALGKPYVVHLHGSGFDKFYSESPQIAKYWLNWFFGRSAYCVVLNTHFWEFVTTTMGVKAHRARIIPNGVLDPQIRATDQSDEVGIVFVGSLTKRKGLDTLCRALASRELSQLRWRLDICGDGQMEDYVTMCRDLNLLHRVHWHGWVSQCERVRIMSTSGIFVLPSLRENAPMAIIEAMAMGIPVISTNVGGIPEQVRDGVDGVLVNPADEDALSSALFQLISDRKLRHGMGVSARRRFERNYHAEENAARFNELYDEIEAATQSPIGTNR